MHLEVAADLVLDEPPASRVDVRRRERRHGHGLRLSRLAMERHDFFARTPSRIEPVERGARLPAGHLRRIVHDEDRPHDEAVLHEDGVLEVGDRPLSVKSHITGAPRRYGAGSGQRSEQEDGGDNSSTHDSLLKLETCSCRQSGRTSDSSRRTQRTCRGHTFAKSAVMPLPLLEHIVYGPVRSRRLGRSLGINLLPAGIKMCNMNCAYCQYGWTRGAGRYRGQGSEWPTAQEVGAAVAARLTRAAETGEI